MFLESHTPRECVGTLPKVPIGSWKRPSYESRTKRKRYCRWGELPTVSEDSDLGLCCEIARYIRARVRSTRLRKGVRPVSPMLETQRTFQRSRVGRVPRRQRPIRTLEGRVRWRVTSTNALDTSWGLHGLESHTRSQKPNGLSNGRDSRRGSALASDCFK